MRTHLWAAKMALVVVIATNLLSSCGKAIQMGDATNAEPVKLNTTLPEHFPVPIVNNSTVVSVVDMPTATKGVKGYSVTLDCEDNVEKVNGYYAYTLSQAGWAAKQMVMPGLNDLKTLFGTKDADQITITMTNNNGKCQCNILVQPIPGADPPPPVHR